MLGQLKNILLKVVGLKGGFWRFKLLEVFNGLKCGK
jgi:hypothetical protein